LGSFVLGHEPPHKAAREAMARSLSAELRPLGISVSLVTTGHFGRYMADLTTISKVILREKAANQEFFGKEGVLSAFATQLNISHRLERFLTKWFPEDNTSFEYIRRAIQSRYPRPTYRVGVDHLVQQALWWIPEALWTLAQRLFWERLWYADRAQLLAHTRKATT